MEMLKFLPSLLVVLLSALFEKSSSYNVNPPNVHTLLLCRHGDSIWNGGADGYVEKFTGWTDVPLTELGQNEAEEAAKELSSYVYDVDVAFTSLMQRAHSTLRACSKPLLKQDTVPPVVYDYRLNERHYGALQGYAKEDVESGKYGHSQEQVRDWRRSWHVRPPSMDDDHPLRAAEIEKYSEACGGPENVPRGESLEMVAKNRVRPFLDEVMTPILDEVKLTKVEKGVEARPITAGLVVAHANSLRALIGVLCEVEDDPVALEVLESLRIPTGVPLVMHYRRMPNGRYKAYPVPDPDECIIDYDGMMMHPRHSPPDLGHESLPVFPLNTCIPLQSFLHTHDAVKETAKNRPRYR